MSQEIRQKITHYERELRRLRKQLRKSKGLGPKRKGRGCRDRDEAMKIARGYGNPSTFVRRDGSEVLKGADWRKRKREIWERAGGRCEHIVSATPAGDNYHPQLNIVRCRSEMHDPHHIIKRSRGRDDRAENLIGLCRMHHELLDPRKVKSSKRTFAVKPAPESWIVVDSDDVGGSTVYDDKEDAQDEADNMNMAFERGQRRVQP